MENRFLEELERGWASAELYSTGLFDFPPGEEHFKILVNIRIYVHGWLGVRKTNLCPCRLRPIRAINGFRQPPIRARQAPIGRVWVCEQYRHGQHSMQLCAIGRTDPIYSRRHHRNDASESHSEIRTAMPRPRNRTVPSKPNIASQILWYARNFCSRFASVTRPLRLHRDSCALKWPNAGCKLEVVLRINHSRPEHLPRSPNKRKDLGSCESSGRPSGRRPVGRNRDTRVRRPISVRFLSCFRPGPGNPNDFV